MKIRKATASDAGSIAKVLIESWRSTYKGLVQDEFLVNLSYEEKSQAWYEILSTPNSTKFVYIAEDKEGQIVGFVAGGPERTGDEIYKGELYAMYLLKEYQRRGIGKQLFVSAIKELLQSDIHSVLLFVLKESPYRRFYDTQGGNIITEKERRIGDRNYNVVAYGWRDINLLLNLIISKL